MSLNPGPPSATGVPLAWVVVIVLMTAGAGIAVTAALVTPHSSPPGSVTVKDDLGRTVTVPYDPARVVVFGASNVDILYRLGLRSHIVGVDCYAPAFGGLNDDYSPDQISLWNLTSSMCVEVEPSQDALKPTLVNLTPTLVLSATIVPVDILEQVGSQLGIPVVFLQPSWLGGIVSDVQMVGQIFGVGSAAGTLAASLNAELSRAADVVANETDNGTALPTVLLTYDVTTSGPYAGYYTYGPGTFGQSLIELTGGSSISANTTTPYPELTPAQVLDDQPDLIVYGVGFGITLTNYSAAPDWSDLSAVIAGNLTGINSNWLAEPDPTMILDGVPALLAFFELHSG